LEGSNRKREGGIRGDAAGCGQKGNVKLKNRRYRTKNLIKGSVENLREKNEECQGQTDPKKLKQSKRKTP